MSVDFRVFGVARTLDVVPCDYGKGEPHECTPANRCGYCEDGWDEVWRTEAPELNVANVTAGILLTIIGLPSRPSGEIGPRSIPVMRRRIVRALSTDIPEREALPAITSGGAGTGQCRVVSAGYDAERIRDRLARLDAVLAWAQTNGKHVVWT